MPTQINPATGETGKVFPELDAQGIEAALAEAERAYRLWRTSGLAERTALLGSIADQFDTRRDELAAAATFEMGKPLEQARAEVATIRGSARMFSTRLDGICRLRNSPRGAPAARTTSSSRAAHSGVRLACFSRPTLPAMIEGAMKRTACQ